MLAIGGGGRSLKHLQQVCHLWRRQRLLATFARGQAKARASELLQPAHGHEVRVRFAPSPTGSLHIGGARTALFNWLHARRTKGKFIVRVEDTDESRSTKASENSILNDLKWLGLIWDEGPDQNYSESEQSINTPIDKPGDSSSSSGDNSRIASFKVTSASSATSAGHKYFGPYRQSERKSIYIDIADKLIQEGKAYRCFCTEEELEAKKLLMEKAGVVEPKYDGTWRDADPGEVKRRLDRGDPFTVRFKLPKGNKIVSFVDLVRENVSWDANAVLGDFILLRSSGVPVYNFCVAVDDALMEITHVIRAEEHLSNTLRQLLILEALGRPPPTYAHCSLILGKDRSKLSKRHGATSVGQFQKMGVLPNAMLNYLTNLGFNDGTTKEIYEPHELINSFDMTRIVKGSAVFDMEKLKWINGQHIRKRSIADLKPMVLQVLQEQDFFSTNNNAPQNSGSSSNSSSSNNCDGGDRGGAGGDISNTAVDNPPILNKCFADRVTVKNQKFLDIATDICRRDMELLCDSHRLISNVLQFNFVKSVENDEASKEIANSSVFKAMLSAILRDYHINKSFPGVSYASENASSIGLDPDAWKTYNKALSQELGIKGKDFFRPFRLALTGSTQGPEIYDQLNLISYIHPADGSSNRNKNDSSISSSSSSSNTNSVFCESDLVRLHPDYKLFCSVGNRMQILQEWLESNKS